MTAPAFVSRLPLQEPGKWWLYLHRDADGSVLYVGCTNSPRYRQTDHRRRSDWWGQVAAITVIGPFGDKPSALDGERTLIELVQPPHNIMRTSREAEVYERGIRTRNERRAKYERIAS
jgi:predicted GIY-YIG superfamily endonuclease